ncbi:MAG: hypothetical protein COT21_02155 [Hadesarchaea archaeon CG08_land_8_20_14_0_20_51_8]|nr:MAG: hypothetical protein COT21_02155 [Hadesarchaea archaeon CG08_land_8_20_14_0_20_51_8]
MNRRFLLIVLAILGILSLSLYLYTLRIGDLRAHILPFEYVFFALFVIYLLALVVVLKAELPAIPTIAIVVGFALIFRLVLLFSPPTLSDDIYRYVWEGKVQAAGINPYTTYPASQELRFLRDKSIYPHLSSKESYAPYQPVAQIFFLFIYLLKADSVFFLKFILILFDMGSIVLIIFILKELKIDLNRALIYAWSPLVVFEIGHGGHVDALIVFLLLAAVLARLKSKPILTGVMLGLAIPIKLYPIIMVPAFLRKRDFKMPVFLAATIGLIYLPYMKAGWQIFRFVFRFQEGPHFNAGLRYFLFRVLGGYNVRVDEIFLLFSLVVLTTASLVVVLKEERTNHEFISHIFFLAALFVVLAPFLAPWYLIFVVPLLCLKPRPSFLYLSGAVMLSYLLYAYQPWQLPDWVRYVEYLPFFFLLTLESIFGNRGLSQKLKDDISGASEGCLDHQAKSSPP